MLRASCFVLPIVVFALSACTPVRSQPVRAPAAEATVAGSRRCLPVRRLDAC